MKSCDECAAEVPEGGTCRDHFDALLALEWQLSGGPGELAHFLAVSSYVLQHPSSMNYTADALAWLRENVADVLSGRVAVAEVRRRAREAARRPGHVTRREGEEPVRWEVPRWPMTVTDALAARDMQAYLELVSRWAGSVVETLRRRTPGTEPPDLR
jgi:hypothetical protein